MKSWILFLSCILLTQLSFAQTPRIALVKPNGTTTIHSTLQAAYDAAGDDDYIYLPGGNFGLGQLTKKLHIIGAGFNIDSSNVTSTTTISTFTLFSSASNSSLEGLKLEGIAFEGEGDGLIIKNCQINNGLGFPLNNPWQNVLFEKNFIRGYFGYQGYGYISINGQIENSIFKNNVILGTINGGDGLLFKNNIFFYQPPQFYSMILANNSTYNNNIFIGGSISVSNSIFNNNVNLFGSEGANNQDYNLITEPFPEIFENPGPNPFLYDVHNDYHIKSTSACKNSGTDGTDRGIYGGTSPWIEGSIPSNPHIYFKQVADETNASGQLQIHFKVRTN